MYCIPCWLGVVPRAVWQWLHHLRLDSQLLRVLRRTRVQQRGGRVLEAAQRDYCGLRRDSWGGGGYSLLLPKWKRDFFFFSRSLALKRSSPLERHTWLLLGLEVTMSLDSFVIFTSQCNSYIQGVWKNRLLIELWAHKHYLIGCSGAKLCHEHHLGALDPA